MTSSSLIAERIRYTVCDAIEKNAIYSKASSKFLMLYLETAVDDDGEADPCLRKLTVMKANYAAKGTTVALRWDRGRFVLVGGPGSFERMAAEAKDDGLFLKLLKVITGQGRNVSPYGGQTNAPKVFAEMPDGVGVKQSSASRKARHQGGTQGLPKYDFALPFALLRTHGSHTPKPL
jgi:hypothetical protein